METDNRESRDLARAISSVVARAPKIESETVIADLDRIEADFLPRVASSEKLELETRRRIAEWKFKLLSERDLPFQRVEKLYDAVRELGYTDLETEGTIAIYFAQYCIRQSRLDRARQTLEALRTKLDKALAVNNLPGHHQLKDDAEKLLSSL